jgi:hypothetical protein
MQYKNIKFGNNVGHMIVDDKTKIYILGILASVLKKNDNVKPGLVANKTYARYVFNTPKVYLLLYINNAKKLPLFIYENNVIYSPIKFSPELYNSDTPLVFSGYFNKEYYIIDDIIIKEKNINTRFKRINYILRNLYFPIGMIDTHKMVFIDYVDQHYIYSLCADYYKKCSYIYDADITHIELIDFCTGIKHKYAIITITKYFEDLLAKFSSNNIYKEIAHGGSNGSIVQLKMYKSDKPDIYHLYDIRDMSYYGIADIPTLEISAYVISIFPPKYVFIITYFVFNEKYSRWRPVYGINELRCLGC